MIKAIIFDCWATLFFNRSGYLSLIAEELGASIEDYVFLKHFEEYLMKTPLSGEGLKERVVAMIADIGIADDGTKASTIVGLMLDSRESQEVYPETVLVLQELKRDYRLALLSNTSQPSFERVVADYDLQNRFDFLLPSYEIGLIKPDPLAFEIACKRLHCEPHEVCMVGDSLADDFKAARACGLSAVLVDRIGRYPDIQPQVKDLRELSDLLPSL